MKRRRAAWLALLAALLITGCAQPRLRPAGEVAAASWHGRLALRVDSTPPESFFADFDLEGSARRGALLLTGPLGQTVARLDWAPGSATLRGNGGEVRQFDSLEALAAQASGTPLPIAALFEWLAGRDALADGWQADLSQLGEGRLTARRLQPEPAAELKLVLEPAEAGPP